MNAVFEATSLLNEAPLLNEIQDSISLVFVNGHFDMDQSKMDQLPPQVVCCPFNAVVSWLKGIFLYIPKDCVISTPIYLIFKNDSDKPCYLRNTIVLEENSKAIIIEEYQSSSSSLLETNNVKMEKHLTSDFDTSFNIQTNNRVDPSMHSDRDSTLYKLTNLVTEIQLEKNASLEYYKLQNESPTMIHHANILIEQKEASNTNLFFADCGAAEAHVHLRVNLNEKYATCHLNGLYQLNHNQQKINNHININHIAEYGTSSMHFKGILDHCSQAEFIGKVHVQEKAQHSHAEQSNHNLLLSSHAEVKTKPELEIYADDVKCSHGATVGQLDEEALFYLRSRGIEKQDALQVLTSAFADDIMNKIENVTIRHYIQKRMN